MSDFLTVNYFRPGLKFHLAQFKKLHFVFSWIMGSGAMQTGPQNVQSNTDPGLLQVQEGKLLDEMTNSVSSIGSKVGTIQ